jgi:hypothetical protein
MQSHIFNRSPPAVWHSDLTTCMLGGDDVAFNGTFHAYHV